VSAFSADWLRLREPFDAAARDRAAPALDLPALAARRVADGVLRVLDLGCGSAANLRWLAPRLGGAQRWRLVDRDAVLLAAAAASLQHWAAAAGLRCSRAGDGWRIDGGGMHLHVECSQADLTRDADSLPWHDSDLVTASALLDLLAAPALERLLDHAAAAGCAQYWALNVDGRRAWAPADADDDLLLAAFARHQGRDKGDGSALGPRAAALARRRLEDAGCHVAAARSDWHLAGSRGPADVALLRALVEGDSAAAIEQRREEPGDPGRDDERLQRWRDRRLAQVDVLALRVGHLDLVALS
jgi:SAM-dependent methyltransferase